MLPNAFPPRSRQLESLGLALQLRAFCLAFPGLAYEQVNGAIRLGRLQLLKQYRGNAMGFLNDKELRLIAGDGDGDKLLIEGIDSLHRPIDIQGCAVDLHIGDIYRPGVGIGESGSADRPCKMSVTLNEGETAVIQSVEKFKLDNEHAAFVFPASSVSIQGLLMTNPGHVDPGYAGPVHVTVINMGREPFALKPKDRFLRAFIYKLNTPAVSPKKPGGSSAVTQELLQKLSPDFMSVNKRSTSAAKKEVAEAVRSIHIWQMAIPLVAAVLAAYISTYSFEGRIKLLEDTKTVDRLKTLELNYPTERRLLEIETQLKQLPLASRPQAHDPASTRK